MKHSPSCRGSSADDRKAGAGINQPTSSENWIATFDWERAGPEARDPAALTHRCLTTAATHRCTAVDAADNADAIGFGRYVEALRHARGWSRPEFAEAAGIDPLGVLLLERGGLTRAELTQNLVQHVARAFRLSVAELAVAPFAVSAAQSEGPTATERFGQSLADLLQTILAPPPRLAERSAGMRGAASTAGLATLDDGILESPVWLREHTLGYPMAATVSPV